MTKETSPLLSIIIPSYNQLEGLKETLNAFSKFRSKHVELVVIDGQSSDDSPNWMRENEASMDCFKIESDKGIYDAMNKGISLATGDAIGILNSDDFYASNDVIENVVKAFKLLCVFYSHYITNVFYYTKNRIVSIWVVAQLTYFKI
jgi:glycosyltransferase involved in cell wall biosynthesis